MAVQYIPKSPSTPLPLPAVRRSTRHLALPPTPSSSTASTITSTSASPNGKSSRVVARSPSTHTTRRKPRQSLATTTPSSPTTPTPASVSGSRSRKRSRFQDEPDQKEQDLAVEPFPLAPSPRTRLGTIIDNRAPITPEPTPRAIRAQKRRKLTDKTAEADTEPASASDSPSSPSSSSPSPLSPTTPHPQPISPEPISPTHLHSHSSSPYIVKSKSKSKSRARKRKLEDDGASSTASSSSDTPTPPASGDPLPRSLAKRRKLDRATISRQKPPRSVRIRSKSKSCISSGTPTPLTSSKKRTSPNLRPSRPRTSVPLPRGGDNNGNDHRRTKNVRRSARLLINTSNESRQQFPSDAQLEESLPLSPLTPPPSEDDASESGQVTDSAIEQNTGFSSSCETQVQPLVEEEDDAEMEMIACIGGVPTNSSSCPSVAHTPTSPTTWIIPSHISNPILKGRPPPNPALYAQLQLASYRRTKPNTPSPLSLYSYTGVTPPTSPGLSAATINSLDAIDDIPPLGETAAAEAIAAIAEGDATLVGLPEQLFHEQQQPQMQFYGQGYSQVESPQQHQSLPGPVFEQPLHQPQAEYRPPANVTADSSASSPESSNPQSLDMNFMMIDLQFQMQLQHIGMQGSAGGGMHFGVDQLGFIMGGNASEERNDTIPTTVHMQDVHLHQQPQSQNHQQQIMDVQPNHQLFGYPYFPTEQAQMQQGSNQLYGTPEYSGGSQSFQGQPEYQQQHQAQRQFQDQQSHHHQEQPQAPSASSYEAYDGIQPYQSGSPQVYGHQHRSHQSQQDFQAQQQQHGGDEVPPFSGSNLNVGYDAGAFQIPTQTPASSVATRSTSTTAVAASTPARGTTTSIPHYTLSMHNALLFFQQSHSRFHEDQNMLAQDAADMHTRQLEEFQRDKEDRKRRLKRTKLVRDLQVVPMGSSAAGVGGSAPGIGVGPCVARARGLWAVACKARMFEVVRIYTPALIREVTEISAREYYRRMGLKYPPCRFALPRYRRRMQRGEDDISISEDDPLLDHDCDHEQEHGDVEAESDDGFDGSSSLEKKDGDADGEEFRNEKIFDFELFDDDEEDEEVMDEARKQMEVDVDEVTDDEDEDEDEDEDGDDGDDDESPENGVDLDLEAIRDPFFQPELSMRITPQEPMPSISGGVETAFYVPPPEVYAVPEQNMATCEDPAPEAQPSSTSSPNANTNTMTTLKQSPKQKFMLFHRPVLPLPPPALSTFRPAALKFYNVDPVHAGRGTPCVKERREVWAGGVKISSLSFTVKQTRRIKDGGDGSSEAVVAGVTAWYYGGGVQTATVKDGSLSAVEPDPPSDACSVPPAEDDDSVFGDCGGTCCMSENAKGKMKAVGVEVGEEDGGVGGKLEEELPGEEEEAQGDAGRPSTSTALPQEPIAQPPPPQPSRHMTVEIPPAHSDRIPHRRRGILGRTELLKVYAPPSRSVPPILPLARRPPRPPRPPSLGIGIGLDETEDNSMVRSLAAHHPPVVPYSWEQVAEAMEVLAYQGIDASVWVDGHGHSPSPSSPLSPSSLSSNGPSGTEVQIQPTFNPSSSELSAALG